MKKPADWKNNAKLLKGWQTRLLKRRLYPHVIRGTVVGLMRSTWVIPDYKAIFFAQRAPKGNGPGIYTQEITHQLLALTSEKLGSI